MNDAQFASLDHYPKVRALLYAHRGLPPFSRGVRLDIPSARRGLEVVTIHTNRSGGKVIGYDHSAVITGADFIVQQTGAEHVANGGAKYPFAFIAGDLVWEPAKPEGIELYYNPRKVKSFVVKSTRQPVRSADKVHVVGKRMFATGLVYQP